MLQLPPLELSFTPKTFDASDAKLIQYKYAIYKLRHLIKSIDAVLKVTTNAATGRHLILITYILNLTPTLFAINEAAFAPRLSALERFVPVKPTPVNISQLPHHVSYDSRDPQVVLLSEVPKPSTSLTCLRNFRTTCSNCLDGYVKRLANAAKTVEDSAYIEDLDKIIDRFFSDPANIDVNLLSAILSSDSSPFVFYTPPEEELLSNSDSNEACLIDIDLQMLFVFSKNISILLSRYRPVIISLNKIKTATRGKQEELLEDLPNPDYALHQVLLWALRLNDLYMIVRRFGRQIYLANHAHLTDTNFLSQMGNGVTFRNLILKSVHDLFNTAKKNGVMIATITRFMRLSTKLEITKRTVLDFFGFISQSYGLLETACRALCDLAENWIPAELIFRKNYSLPKGPLIKLYELTDRYKRGQERKLIEQKSKEAAQQKENAKAAAVQTAPKPPPAQQQPPTKDTSVKEEEKTGDASDSLKSVEPVHEGLCDTSAVESESETRTEEKEKQDVPNGEAKNRTTKAILKDDLFLESSKLTLSNDVDKKAMVTTTPQGRTRSSSQPVPFNTVGFSMQALQPKKDPANSSKAGSSKTLGSPKVASPRVLSPTGVKALIDTKGNKLNGKTAAEVREEAPSPIRLSANQKFALHLKEATRAGDIFSQQRDAMTSVVFDPNNPSATRLRRPQEQTKTLSLHEQAAAKALQGGDTRNSEQAVSNTHPLQLRSPIPNAHSSPHTSELVTRTGSQKKSRAQLTKLNTQRNSLASPVDDDEGLQSLSELTSRTETPESTSKSEDSNGEVVVKKVRFIGVPQYTPEEDYPTKQASRFIQQFAIAKKPYLTARATPGLRNKDNHFKKEESLSLRQQVYHG